MIRVFIGFDPRQPLAFNVCASSIVRAASKPVAITALTLKTLPIKRQGLTQFTYSRFLVPHLCNYEGRANSEVAEFVCQRLEAHDFAAEEPAFKRAA